ncbi:hypothetical protein SLS60_001923 [Paraconiothyrium brasiliense]|uniref:BTB domain-containing protein n=1 Tax=Paraconiothyrium brasiliense TaxID=300254 RepID=A0ABR3S1A8_9PLEO
MGDLDFLDQAAAADNSATSTLMVLLPDGTVTQIHNISRFTLLDKCPLLFHAFEFREFGDVEQASIEATSRSAIVSLLRFLYTGSYLLDPDGCLGSLLPHVEAFKLAEDFDVPEFQVQAYVNFTRETEFSCCNATPPSDLCHTIKFIYQHFAAQESQEHQSLLDTILNYCVSVFTYQVLGDREDFRQTAFENPTFHRDLCRISMSRNFEDDGANEIVQLPVCRPTPHSQSALLKRAIGDFQYEIWHEGDEPLLEANDVANSNPTKKRKPSHGGFMLVHRPKTTGGRATFSESESESDSSGDEYGFSLVHRPKLEGIFDAASTACPTLSETCTNPFADPLLPIVIKSEPGQEPRQQPKQEIAGLTSDDEWDLV